MPDEELNLILRLRDEATSQLSSIRNQVTAAAGAMAAAGLKAGADWDRATKTIIEGTGATGAQLKTLQADYQAVARFGENSATVIADLNTHLGLQGEELQRVSAAALKAGVDTNAFGSVAAQLGLDAEGATHLLDDLVQASQNTGVGVDQMTGAIGKSAARWLAAGGDMEGLTATVVQAADEFGPAGLRGAMSEILAEVDKGVIPAIKSLDDQLGDTTGTVNETYEAGRTWRDVLSETTNEIIASVGPYGDMVGGIGTATAGLLQLAPALKNSAIAQRALNLAMSLNPIGLVVTAIGLAVTGIVLWRDEIGAFLSGAWDRLKSAVQTAKDWLSPLTSMFSDTTDEVERLSDELAGHSLTTALADVREEAIETKAVLDGFGLVTLPQATGQAILASSSLGTLTGQYADLGVWSERASRVVETAQRDMTADVQDTTTKFQTFWNDALGGVSGMLSQFLNGDWKSTLGNMITMGLNTVVPGLGTIANQAFAVFKKAWDWFKRPSETELAAREQWGNIRETVIAEMRTSQEFSDETSRAMAAGWDRETAEMRAAFVLLGQQAGYTYDEAFGFYAQYEEAVRAGDTALMAELEASLQEWQRQSEGTWTELVADAAAGTDQIQAEINSIEGHTVYIEYHGVQTGEHGGEGGEGRQFGGPVARGTPYIVGEAGPEVFVPRASGSIVPNHDLIDYGRLAAAVAGALARTPVRVEQSPLALSALRGAPRIQAQRGWV